MYQEYLSWNADQGLNFKPISTCTIFQMFSKWVIYVSPVVSPYVLIISYPPFRQAFKLMCCCKSEKEISFQTLSSIQGTVHLWEKIHTLSIVSERVNIRIRDEHVINCKFRRWRFNHSCCALYESQGKDRGRIMLKENFIGKLHQEGNGNIPVVIDTIWECCLNSDLNERQSLITWWYVTWTPFTDLY